MSALPAHFFYTLSGRVQGEKGNVTKCQALRRQMGSPDNGKFVWLSVSTVRRNWDPWRGNLLVPSYVFFFLQDWGVFA